MLAKHGVLTSLGRLKSTRSYILCPSSSFSAVIRRQEFLARVLSGSQIVRAMSYSSEVDAESVLKFVTPSLDPKRHKGQAG